MWKVFKYGVQTATRHFNIAFLVYGIQFVLAAILGLQVAGVMDAAMGDSLELSKLMGGYDHGVFSDFMIVWDKSISPLIGQFKWMLLGYLFLSVFLNAGILSSVVRKEHSLSYFWGGAASNFIPFLKIGLFFMAMFAVLTAVFWIPILVSVFPLLEILPSEKTLLLIILLVAIVYVLGVIFLYNTSLFARISYLEDHGTVWASIKSGFRQARKKYLKATGTFLLFFGLLLAISLIYLSLENAVGMTSTFMTLVFFLIQQGVAFFRIVWRVMVYGAYGKL